MTKIRVSCGKLVVILQWSMMINQLKFCFLSLLILINVSVEKLMVRAVVKFRSRKLDNFLEKGLRLKMLRTTAPLSSTSIFDCY